MATATITTLKKKIKDNEISPLYLFYGEESYLIDMYIEKIKGLIDDGGFPEFNRFVADDIKIPLSDISDFLDTYPMMSENKLLIIKDTNIFKSATEEIKQFWLDTIDNLPDYVTLIFAEKEVDKRSIIYKALDKKGEVVEFSHLSPVDLVNWAQRQFLSAKKSIRKEDAEYLVEICAEGLGNLKNEIDKLINYCQGDISCSDIERLVSKSLNVRVFEMTDAIIKKDADTALSILQDMKTVKESAFKILYTLFSCFDKLLLTQLMLQDGESMDVIAKKTKLPPFIAKKYMQKTYNIDFLSQCVYSIAEIDLAIKDGKTDEWTALWQFVTGLFEKR